MADVHDKETRSYNMSQIKSSDTKPEIKLRKALHKLGFRYSLNSKGILGKPDVVLKKYNTLIFVHGCFWHGHKNCKYFKLPKTNVEFWQEKIEKNKERDKLVIEKLSDSKWQVIVVWECQLKKDLFEGTLREIVDKIKNIIK